MWNLFRKPSQKIFRTCLESPLNGEVSAEKVNIRGWVAAPKGDFIAGNIFVNNSFLKPLEINKDRIDIHQAYNLQKNDVGLGFDETLDWGELKAKNGEVDISLQLTNGRDLSVLGPVKVSKADSSHFLHQRGNYKEVWNEASSNHTDAMLAVASIGNFDEFMETGESTARTVKETINITPEDVVLEIGCGTGRIGAALAPQCKRWIGADISGQMLEYAKENLKNHENVDLIELEACNLKQFEDASMDKLYCSVVFMHLEQWDRYRYVTEAFRVLRSGGSCYIDNLNLAGDKAWEVFEQMSEIDPAQRPAQISKCSTGEELVTYLKRAGFC